MFWFLLLGVFFIGKKKSLRLGVYTKIIMLTKAITSLVAIAKMSAHETTPGHTASTASFALIIVSNPSPGRDRFSEASFSASPFGDAIITEASHPYTSELFIYKHKPSQFWHQFKNKKCKPKVLIFLLFS